MNRADLLGRRLEAAGEQLAAIARRGPAYAIGLGAVLAMVVVTGGILAFVLVFVILVEGFA